MFDESFTGSSSFWLVGLSYVVYCHKRPYAGQGPPLMSQKVRLQLTLSSSPRCGPTCSSMTQRCEVRGSLYHGSVARQPDQRRSGPLSTTTCPALLRCSTQLTANLSLLDNGCASRDKHTSAESDGMTQNAEHILTHSNAKMLFKALLCLLIATIFQVPALAAEPDLSWFKNGNPYQIAARCYGAVLLYPSIEFSGEVEILMNIVASDPHLNADISLNNSMFAQPSERGKSLDLIGRNIYLTIRDMQSQYFPIAEVKTLCGNFIKQQRQ